MPGANPDKEVCDKAFSQLYDFFMEGRTWTPSEDMDAYFAWHEGVPNAEWLPDFWEDTAEPDFLLWLLGRVWNRGWLLRPWRAWYGPERFIDECLAAAELDAQALEAQPVERHRLEALSE
jgi:hypothetical protein